MIQKEQKILVKKMKEEQMDKSVMVAYTEVNKILELIDDDLRRKIPNKLIKLFYENSLDDYEVLINPYIPLENQKISKRGLAILGVLNYNYWCDEEEKKLLIKKYIANEEIKEKEAREKYNSDNLFDNKTEIIKYNDKEKIEQEQTKNEQLILYNKNSNFFMKIINKIKKWFKLT